MKLSMLIQENVENEFGVLYPVGMLELIAKQLNSERKVLVLANMSHPVGGYDNLLGTAKSAEIIDGEIVVDIEPITRTEWINDLDPKEFRLNSAIECELDDDDKIIMDTVKLKALSIVPRKAEIKIGKPKEPPKQAENKPVQITQKKGRSYFNTSTKQTEDAQKNMAKQIQEKFKSGT